jgi:O-acetyl-ADP-ribose deacetylase (regulator of RNase III)/uncharacterized protein YwgA
MITFLTGNIFDSDAQALVNTVNTVGVMGKGIALQFKKAFPSNFKEYRRACDTDQIGIGKLFVTKDANLTSGEKIIINFPTKTHWRKPSEYSYIEKGLDDLVNIIDNYEIKSIAIPPLGSGNGGLEWERVKKIIREKLSGLDIHIFVYEPTTHIKEILKKERVKLTNARALLLYLLFDLVRNGEFVSEFSSEKICYFLQRFGAQKYFKLKFSPNFYGPYSGKVRYVLNALNGSYIMGYSDMNKKPFEPLTLIKDGFPDVEKIILENPDLKEIADHTSKFLNGFYSEFSLELLSSLDYLSEKHKSLDQDFILGKLGEWNNRKRSLFKNPRYIQIAIRHLNKYQKQMV